jgi:hypothetical protein
MTNFLRFLLFLLIGAGLGFFMVFFLPYLFVVALMNFIKVRREPYYTFIPDDFLDEPAHPLPHRCGGGMKCESCERLALYASSAWLNEDALTFVYWCEFHAPMTAEPLFNEASRWN